MSDPLEPVRTPLSSPVREACETTDWDEHAVLDVVTFLPATSRGVEGDRQHVAVYRYREPAPPVDRYENGERAHRVQRLTRPVRQRLEWSETGSSFVTPIATRSSGREDDGESGTSRGRPRDGRRPDGTHAERSRMLASSSRVGTGLM